ASLAKAIADARPKEQVLVLDWRHGADDVRLSGEAWIPFVGQTAADVLLRLGFLGKNVNLVGHSWGALVSYELAAHMRFDSLPESPSKVRSIIALDPAANAPSFLDGVGSYDADAARFVDVSSCSWAFYSSSLGNQKTATSALE